MMVWFWKSPIPLKGKDKHDTQTLRLTFLFVAVFYQVDFLCVLPLKNDFLPVCLGTFLGRVVCWITAEDLPMIGLRDFSSCLAIYYNSQINHYSHFSQGAT